MSGRNRFFKSWLALACLACAAPAAAKDGPVGVDAELVIAVDVSYSMDAEEQRLQRGGYVQAITSPEFLAALKLGAHGSVAIVYMEWASYSDTKVLMPWTLIDGPEKAHDVLNLNVVDALGEAWKKYSEIMKYADREKYGPEEIILAPLAEHTVKSKHHPYVEVLLRDVPVGRVEFDLEFSLTLEGFVLKIQDGMIREIKTGSAKGEANLTLASVSLFKRETQSLHFPGHIPLREGILLRGRGKAASAQ